MPAAIKTDYNEARAVASHSPRAAAALLRLAIERLCSLLNGEQPRLDDHIGLLVVKGLNQTTADMFDAVRLGGNNAIHPSDRIGIAASSNMVRTLFWLVNEIVDEVITKPKQREVATAWIPAEERERIEKRNQRIAKQYANQQPETTEPTANRTEL